MYVGKYSLGLYLHQTQPTFEDGVPLNQELNVPPDELAAGIEWARKKGWTFISTDEWVDGHRAGRPPHKTIVLSADDGYRSNLSHGLPVLSSFDVPITIYVTTCFIDHSVKLWWIALDRAIAARVQGAAARNAAFLDGRQAMLTEFAGDPDAFFAHTYPEWEVDWASLAAEFALHVVELSTLSRHPLVTIGGHTTNHLNLAGLERSEASRELSVNVIRLENELGIRVQHVAYPFGSRAEAGPREYDLARELGFSSGATTLKGRLTAQTDPLALPRFMWRPKRAKNHWNRPAHAWKWLL